MRKFVLFFLVVLTTGTLYAQKRLVSGTVTAQDGSNIAGATVMIKGLTDAAVTDARGRYSIMAPANASLLFSSFGMIGAEETIGDRKTINVVLQADAKIIDDVVVNGYGTISRTTFTGVASVVGGETLAKKADANFMKSLEGNLPGVVMNSGTSMPGTVGTIWIRGRNSINAGTDPLYILDGVPINSDADAYWSAENYSFDPLASINPEDIESLTVLKDAAATAIYGTRASGGVIVITTKKGSLGKFNVDLNVKQGFVSMGNHNMQYANAQETLDYIANGRVGEGKMTDYNSAVADLKKWYEQFGWDGVSSYDWVDAVTRKGHYQDYNLGISGRTGSTGYYVSMGYLNTKGLVIASDLERFTGRVNVDSKFKCFTFGTRVSYAFSTRNGFSESTDGTQASPLVSAVSFQMPMYPFYNEEGMYANTPSTGGMNLFNPLAVSDPKTGNILRSSTQIINLAPYLQVDFGLGIYVKTQLGVNLNDAREYVFMSQLYDKNTTNGMGMLMNARRPTITLTNILGWNHVFSDKHRVNLMLGQEMVRRSYIWSNMEKSDFPFVSGGLRDLTTAGGGDKVGYTQQDARLASYFVDAHYSYVNRYVIGASGRLDGSSVFGEGKRWHDFWSVSAKWNIGNESFLKGNRILTSAAVNFSYGEVGNQEIGFYASRGLFSTGGAKYMQMAGMVPISISNPELTWETSKKFDIGVSVSFVSRMNVTLNLYTATTVGALFNVPISMTTGIGMMKQNLGSLRNRGVEFSINADIFRNRDWSWNVYANLSHNRNKVLKLATEKPMDKGLGIIEVGRPYNQFYMREWAGVDPETGRSQWYLNATGSETTNVLSHAAKRYLGSADPKIVGGFGTTLAWKGVDFNLSFNYRAGGKVYISGAVWTGAMMGVSTTPLKEVMKNRWTPEHTDAIYPKWQENDPDSSNHVSSLFLRSGNFLRISNISLGYTLPVEWTKKAIIEKLRFYVSVDNLYTFTAKDFLGYNPETYSSGLIAWQYPLARTFIGGVQITF